MAASEAPLSCSLETVTASAHAKSQIAASHTCSNMYETVT